MIVFFFSVVHTCLFRIDRHSHLWMFYSHWRCGFNFFKLSVNLNPIATISPWLPPWKKENFNAIMSCPCDNDLFAFETEKFCGAGERLKRTHFRTVVESIISSGMFWERLSLTLCRDIFRFPHPRKTKGSSFPCHRNISMTKTNM